VSEPDQKSIIRFPRSVWLLALGWIVLTAGAAVWGVAHQQGHLTGQAAAALSGTTMTAVFEGRDAQLSGQAPSRVELDRARTTILTQRGVRTVATEGVTVAHPSPDSAEVPLQGSTLEAEFSDGTVTLRGVVPDSATEDAITAAIGGNHDVVVSDVDIHAAVHTPAWLPLAGPAIASVDGLSTGTVGFAGDTLIVTGEVASEELQAQILAGLGSIVGGSVTVDDRLVVVHGAAPSMEASFVDGELMLTGDMPDRQTVEAIEGSAALAYGPDNLVSELSVGSVSTRDYLGTLPDLFSLVRRLLSWRVTLADDRLVLVGSAVDESAVDEIANSIAGLGTDRLDVATDIVVDLSGLAGSLTDLLSGTTNFELGSATLSDEARDQLDEAIALLLESPATTVIVEGHTDNVGSALANQALSEARSQAVVEYLAVGGIDPARLIAVGVGEADPIASNDTPEGRAANRRIEFVVVLEGEE